MFGAYAGARLATSLSFVSGAARSSGCAEELGLGKNVEAVRNTRNIGKRDMIHNHYAPAIEVDPQTYEVRADGELLTCEPAAEVAMAQRYFLF